MSGEDVRSRPQAARREAFAAGRRPEADARGPGQPQGPRAVRTRGGAARPVVTTIEGGP